MIELVLIGFLGGLVTGISPCILPVLPVIFAAGAASGLPEESIATTTVPAPGELVGASSGGSNPAGAGAPPVAPGSGVGRGDGTEGQLSAQAVLAAQRADRQRRRRPYAVVGGLVVSFTVFTLIGSWLLSALGLPLDALRWIGLIILGVVGLGLFFPSLGDLLEIPFARLSRGQGRAQGGGLVLGLSLGLVFVPCAGPVLAAITVVGATHRFGLSAFVLTAAFAAGAAVPLLIFALLGQRLTGHMAAIRTRAAAIRRVVGAVLVATALVLAFNLTDGLQRTVPGYTDALQNHIEGNPSARHALSGLTGNHTDGSLSSCNEGSPTLQECGPAPAFRSVTKWLNTPGGRPLSIAGLKGRVVLVDFWTYSCINCQRSLPHVEAWNKAYGAHGLTVVGVHTPEFAFEHVPSNVASAARQLGVDYPIAIDDNYGTWDAYENEYWPAEYLVDATGHIRHVDFGEGLYGQTETLIRQLIKQADPKAVLPAPTDLPDLTPTDQTTPESYLGYQRLENLDGQTVEDDQMASYQAPASVPQDQLAYGGNWNIGSQSSTSGTAAKLLLHFGAKDVYLVLGGTGTITVSVNGMPTKTVKVDGVPRLYQLVGPGPYQQSLLSLSVSPGVQAYDFTFG